ncbi:MAG: class I SAM-dependent methyltransferase [Spirochaetales bacterium]|nr:class I SAM-dependent methyltransferase [Spirochaetales bacterium]
MKTFSQQPGDEARQRVPCPLCASDRRKRKYSCEGFSFDVCRNCGLIYQNPRPSPEAVLGRYNGVYFEYEKREEQQFLELMLKGLNDVRFFDISAGREKEGFLDIGCATGSLIAFLRDKGYTVRGLEICRESADYGVSKRGLDISTDTLEESRFASGSFMFVHCSHVIEHLTDPAGFVREISRILKTGGYLLVATPDASGFQARLYKQDWRSCIADHMVLFTKTVLKRLLKEEGFSIERIRTWGGLAAGAGHPQLKKLLDPAAKRFGFGDVVMIAARKNRGKPQPGC